jgi:cytochrome b subunit of formate dehydrogenase
MNRWALVLAGAVATLAGAVAIAGQVLSGAQPWGPTLADNLAFAKAIPFTIGLGVLVGAVRGLAPRVDRVERRAADGAVRRFSPGTAALHWMAALGFLLALVSGAWQYLKGVLDVESPVFMPWVYRTHYIGAALLLFSMSSMLTYWWIAGVGSLLPPRGQRIRHLRGLAHELPKPLGGLLGGLLGLDMRRQPPPVEQFTYYETTVSFPTWVVLLGFVTITGLLKAMRYIYPIPGDVLWWASTLHVAGLVLLAAKLLDHLRYVFAPSRWPLLTSMVSTWIGERYTQLRHPGWYAQIEEERGASPARSEAPHVPPATPAAPPGRAVGSTGGGGR